MTPQEKLLKNMMSELDDQQRHVASWTPKERNLRVVSAAGSGKTSSVVALAANLVLHDHVAPSALIVTTFSRKAADELRNRMAKVIPMQVLQQMRIGTFHSIGLQALRSVDSKLWSMDRCVEADGSTRATGVPSAYELWTAICSYGKVPGIDQESLKVAEPSSVYKARIDYWRSQGFRRFEDTPGIPGMIYADKENHRRAWKMYTDAKKALKVWDFADVLEAWEDGLKNGQLPKTDNVVIVDEAQDNNVPQTNIIKLLAGKEGRICLVGDLRQSIYSFRGAFPELFTSAEVLLNAETREIGTNYRSEAPIVALSNFIASGKNWNLGSPAKPSRCTENAPYSIEVLPPAFGPDEEAEAVASRISDDVSAGESAGNYAILCRTNAGRALFEAALTRKGVPVTVIGGSSVFKTREAEAVLAYCVLAQHDALGSLDRILNMPKRFLPHSFLSSVHKAMPVSADILDAIEVASREAKLKPGSRRGAADLIRDLERLRSAEWKDVPKLIEKILKSDPSREAEAADEDRMSLITSACRIAERFPSAIDFVAFAQKCSDGTAQLAEGAKASNSVTLATVHSCKGLEFSHVYVSSNRSMFPHIKSTNRDEEHRLFYVAVTRAVNKVVFSYNKLEGLTNYLPPVEKFAEFLQTSVQ